MSVNYVKFCPRCQSSTPLDTAICARCGHQFRSHLVAPVSEKTLAMSPVTAPTTAQTTFAPRQKSRVRVPRPLLALIAGVLALAFLIGFFVSRAHQAASRSDAAMSAAIPAVVTDAPPYDVVFLPAQGQRMVPVATKTVADLQRWITLEKQFAAHNSGSVSKGDYPETVRLYLSGRILLISAGTHGRVLTEDGSWRQVKILDGLHRSSVGYVPQNSLGRTASPTAAANAPTARLTIP